MSLDTLNKDWLRAYPSPLIIAGPCSAETQEQLTKTAEEMAGLTAQVPIFRAGIWKPRTKPNGFEGVGKEGLIWMKNAAQEFGFKTTTEVANAEHVQEALAAGIDILWIGARTTTNPFAVQEIADALQGADVPVLIKNPVNPDLALWIGAFERLQNAGLTRLGAIHRGFSTYKKLKYRNEPQWQIPLDFIAQHPNIPMLIDPSHIVGSREGLLEVAQRAFRLGYDGMMIETHCDPDAAWSDAKQQITPQRLQEILSQLKTPDAQPENFGLEMERNRTTITEIDKGILELLRQRMDVSREIAEIKKKTNAPLYQPGRWKEVQDAAEAAATEKGLSPEFVRRCFQLLHEYSIEVQQNHIDRPKI